MAIFSLDVASVEPTQALEINMVERWGVYELALTGPETGNPFVDVELTAEFALNGRVFEPHGFYDGDGVYKIRFMPDTVGEWTYITKSNHANLDGKTGQFTCIVPSANNRGPVRVHIWWAKGGVLRGDSRKRIAFLKSFMADAPAFDALEPIGDDSGRYVLAKPGEYYLVYTTDPQTITLELSGNQLYKIDAVDTWNMEVVPIGTAQPGAYIFAAPYSDFAYRFTPLYSDSSSVSS